MAAHLDRLRDSYAAVGQKTWLTPDFQKENLEVSRRLYEPKSLELRKPKPKNLEVYALLSGLPFPGNLTEGLVQKQREISAIIGKALHYWVKPANLGLEYFVFKWPEESISRQEVDDISVMLESIRGKSFLFEIKGLQVNPDGCVIARGYDRSGTVFGIREAVKLNSASKSHKQSAWAHVPLGRILEPLGPTRFSRLRDFFADNEDNLIASSLIGSVKFIHETRWYMEKREVIRDYPLRGLQNT